MGVPPEPLSKLENEAGVHTLFQKIRAQRHLYMAIRDDKEAFASGVVHRFLKAREEKTSVDMGITVFRKTKNGNSSHLDTPMFLTGFKCQVLTFHPTEEGYVTYLRVESGGEEYDSKE
jgi:hypothetical protein